MWYLIVAAIFPFIYSTILAILLAKEWSGSGKPLLQIIKAEGIGAEQMAIIGVLIVIASLGWIVVIPIGLVVWRFVAVFRLTYHVEPLSPAPEDDDEDEDEDED